MRRSAGDVLLTQSVLSDEVSAAESVSRGGGSTMIEYVLLVSLISMVTLTAITAVGRGVKIPLRGVSTALDPSGTSGPNPCPITDPQC